MHPDGQGSAVKIALEHIQRTIIDLKRTIAEIDVNGDEKLQLAVYLMDMLLISTDPSEANGLS